MSEAEAHPTGFVHVVEKFGFLVAGAAVLVLAVVNGVSGRTELGIALGVCAVGLLAAAVPAVQASAPARIAATLVQLGGAIVAGYLLLNS